MIKLIASDIDGTLVGKNHSISNKNLEAIFYAINKGVHFTIASGRAYDDITPIYKGKNFKCQVIAVNGAQYHDEDGQVLASCLLDLDACLEVCRIFTKERLHFMLYTSAGVFTTLPVADVRDAFVKRKIYQAGGTYEEVFDRFSKEYIPFQTLTYVEDFSTFLNESIDIYKVEGFDPTKEKIDTIKPLIQHISNITYLSSFFNNIEVTNSDAKKGDILKKAIKALNILPEEVLVIGDGANDMSLFEQFENSVAVSNAIDEIKEKAKYIVKSADDDGVAEAIYKLIK